MAVPVRGFGQSLLRTLRATFVKRWQSAQRFRETAGLSPANLADNDSMVGAIGIASGGRSSQEGQCRAAQLDKKGEIRSMWRCCITFLA